MHFEKYNFVNHRATAKMAERSGHIDLPLPLYLEKLAEQHPERIITRVLAKRTTSYESRDVTIAEFSRAVDTTARWLDEKFGEEGDSEVVAFLASGSDLRYMILLVAAVKSNRLAFFPSPRNDVQAQCKIFEEYGCRQLLLPKRNPLGKHMERVVEKLDLAIGEVPDLDDLLDAEDPTIYSWALRKNVDIRYEPMVGIHTSGSTGLPKPVVVKHGNFTAIEHWKRIPELGGSRVHFTHWSAMNILLAMPLFHLAGIDIFFAALVHGFTLLLPPDDSGPLSAEIISDIIQQLEVDSIIVSPSILADMTATAKMSRSLSQIKAAMYGGGPLPQAAGDTIVQYCDLYNLIGTSEGGVYPTELLARENWQYIKVSHQFGFEMRPHADDLHEMVFVRHEKWQDFQVPFFTFPKIEEYATKDLFKQHPSQPDLWSWQGRTDDVVVFSNGEKFNPTGMENIINGSPHVKNALVYGNGKFQSALLVEPNVDDKDPATAEDIIDRIWPTVQEANARSAAHGRVTTDMILITDPERPLPRAGKGTVQREAAFKLYERDLEELYAVANGDMSHSARKDSTREDESRIDVRPLTRHILATLRENSSVLLQAEDDFFAAGIDSLGVTILVRSLRRILGDNREVAAKAIYEHPTALQLARYLCDFGSAIAPADDPTDLMQELYLKYTFDLPITARAPSQSDLKDKVVILTGSTGSFGTYLLDRLLRDESVAHIICLNRRENAEDIQRRSLEDKGLSTELHDKSITFAVADFSKQYLGLDAAMYKALLSSVTHILHNAWHVNFNLPIQHFESPHISGVSQLVDFSARSTYGAMIFFVSSIGAVQAYESTSGSENRSVPENAISDWSCAPRDSGYSQSKLVAENILAAAAREAHVPCAIVRVGQLAGPLSGTGVWPRQEWLPSLVVSSRYMNCLPATLGSFDVVDWVPVDLAAKAVIDFFNDAAERVRTFRGSEMKVYHCVNPRKTHWDTLLPAIQPLLGVHTVIPSQKWVELLEKSEDEASTDKNPAAKLVTFYKFLVEAEMQVPLETKHSEEASRTLRTMTPITGEMMARWLRRWV